MHFTAFSFHPRILTSSVARVCRFALSTGEQMNIRLLITAAVAVLSISAFAQKPPAGGQHPGGPMHGGPGMGMRRGMDPELKKELGLTAAQDKKLQQIRDKYTAKYKAMGMKPGQPNQHIDFEKMRPIFEAQRKEME